MLDRRDLEPRPAHASSVRRFRWHPPRTSPTAAARVLRAAERTGAANVLHEAQLTARPQNAPQLRQRLPRVADAAEHQRRDGRIDDASANGNAPPAPRARRYCVRRAAPASPVRALACAVPAPSPRRAPRAGSGRSSPRAGADLEHIARKAGKQAPQRFEHPAGSVSRSCSAKNAENQRCPSVLMRCFALFAVRRRRVVISASVTSLRPPNVNPAGGTPLACACIALMRIGCEPTDPSLRSG